MAASCSVNLEAGGNEQREASVLSRKLLSKLLTLQGLKPDPFATAYVSRLKPPPPKEKCREVLGREATGCGRRR